MTAIARPAFMPRTRPVEGLRSFVRGNIDEAVWVRPAFFGVLTLAAVLYLWNLTVSGYANTYYSAAALAGSQSWSAWFFGSFDASNFITVDEPPLSTRSTARNRPRRANSTSALLGPNASGPPDGGLRGGFGAATVTGTVVSVARDSITVKLASGQTVTVATGSSTTYHNQTAGSGTDLAAGQTVQVQTSGGTNPGANASASPNASAGSGTQTTRTATDVTITSK
jgi:hypothetical protein